MRTPSFDADHGVLRDFLKRLDDRGDVGGRLRRSIGEVANLLGYDRETASGIAGARRLDRGVERQQVGPLGDEVDGVDDAADLVGALAHLAASPSPIASSNRAAVRCPGWTAEPWRRRLRRRARRGASPRRPVWRTRRPTGSNDRAGWHWTRALVAESLIARPLPATDWIERDICSIADGVLSHRRRQVVGHRADFLDRRRHFVDGRRRFLGRGGEIGGVAGDAVDRSGHLFDRCRRLVDGRCQRLGVARDALVPAAICVTDAATCCAAVAIS